MEEKKNPMEAIFKREPWKPYLENLITTDTFMSSASRRSESLNGPWNFTEDIYNMCLRADWHKFSTSESIYETFSPFFPSLGIDPEQFPPSIAQEIDLTQLAPKMAPLDFDFEQWPLMKIPCCWNMTEEKYFNYEGSMVFTRKISQKAAHGERVFLRVAGANYRCAVFLDGDHLGTHLGGGGEFYVEVTDRLTEKDNRLILLVDNTRRGDQVPMDNCDWFNYGGLHRDIELIFTPEIFIKDFTCSLVPDGSFNNIRCTVQLSDPVDGEALLSIPELGDPVSIKIKKGGGEVKFSATPELWSPENPRLYDLSLSFSEDRVTDRIGFREIITKGSSILLNGKEIFLKGISCHEESVTNGRSLTELEVTENFKLIKELGGNFMRLAHYPHHIRSAQLADEMGILLWEEIPVYWAIDFENPVTLADAKNQLSELILRDRNRASVIIWSVGNENEDTPERFSFMKALVERARDLDTERLVSAACLVNWDELHVQDNLAAVLDVIGINEYFGWYYGGIEKMAPMFKEAEALNKPFIISETGGGALAGHHGEETDFFTEERQQKIYEDQIAIIKELPNIGGMTPWILYDFRAPFRTNSFQRGYNRKGLLSPDKKKRKLAFSTLQGFYQE